MLTQLVMIFSLFFYVFSFFKNIFYLFIFRERGREGEEREGNINVWLHPMYPHWGPVLHATQACALTGNQTGDHLVHRPALNPLSYSSQVKAKFDADVLFYSLKSF